MSLNPGQLKIKDFKEDESLTMPQRPKMGLLGERLVGFSLLGFPYQESFLSA